MTDSWSEYRLDEIALIQGGGTPKRSESAYFDGNIPWVTPTDLPPIGIVSTLNGVNNSITELGLAKSSAKLIEANSVLFSTRASIGKIAVTDKPCTTNQGFANFTPYENKVDVWFLSYLLAHSIPKIAALAGKTTFPEVPRTKLKEFKVALPSLQEQQRIVARIKECLGKVDEVEALASEIREDSDILRTALLQDAVARLSDQGEMRDLGTLIKVASGQFLPAKKMAKNGTYNVYGGNGVAGKHDTSLFKDPVVIIGRVGAKCGCVHITTENSWVTDNALYVKEEIEPFDQRYLAYMLEAANLRQHARQAAQPVISGKAIYAAQIPYVDIDQQSEVADNIEAACSSIQEIDNLQKGRNEETSTLRESILHQAFSGEL